MKDSEGMVESGVQFGSIITGSLFNAEQQRLPGSDPFYAWIVARVVLYCNHSGLPPQLRHGLTNAGRCSREPDLFTRELVSIAGSSKERACGNRL